MSSIHDVAAMAGVSTATVSKHINKTGYVSPEKRDAIDRAIAELNYAPNRSARMLKTNVSRDILFVVPNMMEKLYRELAESASLVLGGEFRVLIQLTKDDPVQESRILQDCLNNPCAGLLLVTCQPENTELLAKVQKRMPVVFLLREPKNLVSHSFASFNHFESVYAITQELLELGFFDIALFSGDAAFSCEQDCITAFQAAYQHKGLQPKENRIFSVPFSKEVTFLKIMPLFDSGRYPQAFICTSQVAARAISEVAFFRNMTVAHDILVFSLGEDSWYDSMFTSRIISTYRDARKLGTIAANALVDAIRAPLVYEPINIKLNDGFAFDQLDSAILRLSKNVPSKPRVSTQGKIRLLLNRVGSGADALRSLLPQYTQTSHVEVEFTTLPHDELHDLLISNALSGSSEYDLFSVDAPWLSHLASLGAVADLTGPFQESDIPSRLVPEVLENVSTRQGHVYGLPYTHTHQLLFYRKDLFEDPDINAAFYEKYRVKLQPPRDWNMFNIIAAFFTQSSNPASPTPFGASLFGGSAAHLCTELYPRIWAYNGSVIDRRGFVRLYSPENKKAYQSLFDTMKCAPPDAMTYYVDDGLEQLMEKNVAMCIAFSNTASILVTHAAGFLSNNIGYAPIPSQKPIVSGWNICINANSKHSHQAWDFIQWFSSMEIASAYTILGGSAPVTSLLEQEALAQLYPWNAMACREYHTAIHRDCPVVSNARVLDQAVVEQILASVVYQCLHEGITLDASLLRAHKTLCEYAEANGYPQNAFSTAGT